QTRIPVGENFRILAWIDRDRANIEYFRRRRLGKRRHRETNKRDHKTDFSNRRNHPHKSPFNSSSLLISSLGSLGLARILLTLRRRNLAPVAGCSVTVSSNEAQHILI